LFTDFITDAAAPPLPLPLAHAEGRFVSASPAVQERLAKGEGIALVYSTRDGKTAEAFPDNPNGSSFAIAAMTNRAGNVLALMPHPERASWYHQVPRRVGGDWGLGRDRLTREQLFAPGPGSGFFSALKRVI
jgi:phosphoribosylformylglycinamidine (FGAM) synthase-like amidotransferase family enzyme